MPNKFAAQFCLASGVLIYFLSMTSPVQAQITPDGTLSTEVTPSNNLHFTITGNSQSGANLFHSFKEFSVPTGGSAIFKNATNIQNIFIRVTGGSISSIDGLIKANGSASLFLLNPSGIIFGRNAQLAIGGSFIATTANQINFADGTLFSATNLQTSPLLTVSIPIGLQFRETPGDIINRANSKDSFERRVGLQVKPNKTIALIGGNVLLDGGILTASGGRIEVGSVAGNSFVNLIPMAKGWEFGYESVQNFQNIQLFQNALISTSGEIGESFNKDSGDINLYGEQITATGNSGVEAYNDGTNPGGAITLKASKSVEFSEQSAINTNAYSTGAAGNITIEAEHFIVRDRSIINASNEVDGSAGNITVNTSEFVEIDGSGGLSQLTASQTSGSEKAGNLTITTQRLFLRDGGQILSSTVSFGDGGTVSINASEFIEISGRGVIESGSVVNPSGIFAQSIGKTTTGNGGNLNINTGRLLVRDGGEISVGAIQGSTGQAGNLNINASSIHLSDYGTLSAETQAGEGNITLQVQNDTILRNHSKITTNATGDASGGNITINTRFLIGSEDSDITANSSSRRGGAINITAQGVLGFFVQDNRTTFSNDITAFSEQGAELNGTVELNTPEIDPSQGLLELPEAAVINPTALVAQNPCKQGKASELTISGRGGLPPSITEDLSSGAVEVDLVEPVPTQSRQTEKTKISTPATSTTIEPSQGWIFNEKGEVVLTAYNPTITEPQRLPSKSACSTL